MPATSDIIQYFRGQLFQMPVLPKVDLSGKTVVITGANTGLGFECAKQLASLNASTIVLGCRNISKGESAKQSILTSKTLASGATIHVWQVDMSAYASVMSFAERIRTELPRLDTLIANAGISTRDFELAEQFESTLTVNVVSTFLLALLALPRLRYTAAHYGAPTHLTMVGSVVHCFAAHDQLQTPPQGRIFETLSDPTKADMAGRYFLSKLILMLGVRELAKKSPGKAGVVVNTVNPGWCKTELFRSDDGGFFARNLLRLIGRTSEVGAKTLTQATVAGPESHGQYLSECRIKPPSVFVRSAEGSNAQKKIWEELEAILSHLKPGIDEFLRVVSTL